ncbi:hypothetical protein TNIN_180001 [Trichonephila inaurata madagascariensis]|uniref:Transposase n=1 Tax=Trichonephila inaurata madagascariensis TaxID=2747483 RepID=A0A8X7BZK8_9ARAC|nr:hypothetical protein TNIN_180001 [Trichonephila inaurata madagascariensis]
MWFSYWGDGTSHAYHKFHGVISPAYQQKMSTATGSGVPDLKWCQSVWFQSCDSAMCLVSFGVTVDGHKYLDMWIAVVLQLQARPDSMELFFQQDEGPPHYSLTVRQYLDKVFPHHSMED